MFLDDTFVDLSGSLKPCWQKPCWQTCAHGLHGYVGASARVAPLRKYSRFSQRRFLSGATHYYYYYYSAITIPTITITYIHRLAPTYPRSPRAQIRQHGVRQHS